MAECNSDEVVHLYIHGDLDLKIIKARCESIIGPYVKVCLGRTDMAPRASSPTNLNAPNGTSTSKSPWPIPSPI